MIRRRSIMILLAVAGAAVLLLGSDQIDSRPAAVGYKVLPPIRHANLTIFPVVATSSHDTRSFLSLDEGLRSGEVVVTESDSVRPLIRRRPNTFPPYANGGARVNQLLLVNNSTRPLLLLAGEIVTGGKQDRVIAKDRLVPPESDPIDLGVFCVEPGRWLGTSTKFNSVSGALAAPSVRAKAMADKDQEKVWSEVRRNQAQVIAQLSSQARETTAVESTSSYARVIADGVVQQRIDSIAAPIDASYRGLMKQLRAHNAVGVVVAVNGELIWADLFASTDLLEKYWPKLVRSYAAEAMVTPEKAYTNDAKSAQAFLENLEGRREVSETEPGLYRHTEISGEDFKAFELTSLLPKLGFDLHIAKMAD
ncbi:MAG: hypothetical protein JO249_13685 [Acidobacteria bacterium]|nr:hypothetical protein [Acidobacteriota bacterium]